jgi:periplasmic divalent cation tolerance protein
MTSAIQIITTTGAKTDAERLAAELVQRRLAACAQVSGPITSTYRWQGKVETAQEWLCTFKTRRDLYARVQEAILALHPYEQPEILAVPVADGSAGYLAWLDEQVLPPGSQ